jgi:hypothetical protein
MHVLGGHAVVQNRESIPPLGLIELLQPTFAIPRELQQELPLVATVSQMPDLPRDEMPVRARHTRNTYNPVFELKMRVIGAI